MKSSDYSGILKLKLLIIKHLYFNTPISDEIWD